MTREKESFIISYYLLVFYCMQMNTVLKILTHEHPELSMKDRPLALVHRCGKLTYQLSSEMRSFSGAGLIARHLVYCYWPALQMQRLVSQTYL